MRFIYGVAAAIIFLLLSSPLFAATNPISWTLDRPFPVPAAIGTSTTITYTLTNQLPFKLVKALVITKVGTPSNAFTYVDNCSGLKLNSQQSCTVQISLDPQSTGKITFQLIIAGYSNDRVKLPLLTTNTSGSVSEGITADVSPSLPNSMTVGSSGNYGFSFTNNRSTSVTGVSITSNQSSNASFTTTNCGSTLPAGQTCVISGKYTPSSNSPSSQSVYATFNFTQGSPITEITSTSVSGNPIVIGTLLTPLPAEMVGGPSNTKAVKFNFVNYSQTQDATNVTGSVVITTGTGATFTPGTGANFNCNTVGTLVHGTSGAAGGSCNMNGTFEAPVTVVDTQFIITATVTYKYAGVDQPNATVTTNTWVVPVLNTYRDIKFVNNCPFDVWWSFHGAATSQATCTATQSGDQGTCTTGSSCYLPNPSTSNVGSCFWNNPSPEVGSAYHLLANNASGTNHAHIPLTSVDPIYQWSGTISASTGCSGTSCNQADCSRGNANTSPCAVGIGFEQPATQAEPTFLLTGADAYDVETINGFHIPISMTPDAHLAPDNYYCGAAASSTAGNGFGGCNWSTSSRPSVYYNWVTASSTACGTGNSCAGGQLCGISLDRATATLSNLHCGDFLGYWTPDQACSLANAPASFQCTSPYLPTTGTSFPSNSTYYDLMKCSVSKANAGNPLFNTCYASYTGYSASQIATCCGCVDWWETSQTGGVTIAANSTATTCPAGNTNPYWTSTIRPMVQWMKQACPSAYVYPFDDKSSSFTCSNNTTGSPNSAGYTITFCPGNSGIPTGVTAEGR